MVAGFNAVFYPTDPKLDAKDGDIEEIAVIRFTDECQDDFFCKTPYFISAINIPKDGAAQTDDMAFLPMLDASEEFQAAIFNALHGFYRPSISCARNALELVAIGTACQALKLENQFIDWRNGKSELGLGWACDRLMRAERLENMRMHLETVLKDSFFDQKTSVCKGGWIRRFYCDELRHDFSPCVF